jgi:hypothetical protein
MQSMVIQMNDRQLQTLAQLQAFLDGTTEADLQFRRGAVRLHRPHRTSVQLRAPEAGAEG